MITKDHIIIEYFDFFFVVLFVCGEVSFFSSPFLTHTHSRMYKENNKRILKIQGKYLKKVWRFISPFDLMEIFLRKKGFVAAIRDGISLIRINAAKKAYC